MLFASMVPKESLLSLKLMIGGRTCSVAGILATEHAHGGAPKEAQPSGAIPRLQYRDIVVSRLKLPAE